MNLFLGVTLKYLVVAYSDICYRTMLCMQDKKYSIIFFVKTVPKSRQIILDIFWVRKFSIVFFPVNPAPKLRQIIFDIFRQPTTINVCPNFNLSHLL